MKKILCVFLGGLILLLPEKNFAQNSSPSVPKGGEKFVNIPKLVRGPYLQVATDTSMIVRWRTDASVRSRVRYGTSKDNLENVADDLSLNNEHEIKLVGLKPKTKYYYSIGTLADTLQIGSENYFTTLPSQGEEGLYRIGVFGDCGALTVNQAKVRDQFMNYLGKNDLQAWILLGDNAYNDGNDMEYQAKFFNPYKEQLLKKYPVFPSPGNHDYHDADFSADYAQNNHTTPYYQNFSMPINGESGGVPSGNPAFYSFNIGNIHFISLDSYGKEESKYFLYDTLGPQVEWLKKDLEANKNKGWVITYWHHPPYSKGTHDSDTDDIMSGVRENLLRILDRYEVDLVLTGHSHVYERSYLMKGHYGKSTTFDKNKYNLSNSSGIYNETSVDKPYIKNSGNGNGAVYVVSGSSSYVGKAYEDFPHPAMYYSNDSEAGAAILEIEENRLDFKWICSDGIIRDQFTMMKDVNKQSTLYIKKGESVILNASFVADNYKWNNGKNSRSITVNPTKTTTYQVSDQKGFLKDSFKIILKK